MINDFQDYYELLELSPKANLETIERVFRYFATKWHPDAGGDKNKFALLVKAYETLRNPELRAAYDNQHQKHQLGMSKLIEDAAAVRSDSVDRHKLLCLFYARRRQDARSPGLALTTVETLMNCPAEVLEFHIWYFREKGWIQREDNGCLSITALGVDRIESGHSAASDGHQLIACQPGAPVSNATRGIVPTGSYSRA